MHVARFLYEIVTALTLQDKESQGVINIDGCTIVVPARSVREIMAVLHCVLPCLLRDSVPDGTAGTRQGQVRVHTRDAWPPMVSCRRVSRGPRAMAGLHPEGRPTDMSALARVASESIMIGHAPIAQKACPNAKREGTPVVSSTLGALSAGLGRSFRATSHDTARPAVAAAPFQARWHTSSRLRLHCRCECALQAPPGDVRAQIGRLRSVTVGTPGNGFDQIQNLQPLPPHRKTEPDAKPSIVGLPSTEQGSSLKSIFTKLSSRNGPVPSTNAHNAECATLPRCTELRSGSPSSHSPCTRLHCPARAA